MFSSKELGDCNPQTQRNTPTSTNAAYAHGCHHMSLLVLAMTRRHAICDLTSDTCSCSLFTQSKLNMLTQLSVPLQGCYRTYNYSLTSCTVVHTATHPLVQRSDPALMTQHSCTREQPDSHYRITTLIPTPFNYSLKFRSTS